MITKNVYYQVYEITVYLQKKKQERDTNYWRPSSCSYGPVLIGEHGEAMIDPETWANVQLKLNGMLYMINTTVLFALKALNISQKIICRNTI